MWLHKTVKFHQEKISNRHGSREQIEDIRPSRRKKSEGKCKNNKSSFLNPSPFQKAWFMFSKACGFQCCKAEVPKGPLNAGGSEHRREVSARLFCKTRAWFGVSALERVTLQHSTCTARPPVCLWNKAKQRSPQPSTCEAYLTFDFVPITNHQKIPHAMSASIWLLMACFTMWLFLAIIDYR